MLTQKNRLSRLAGLLLITAATAGCNLTSGLMRSPAEASASHAVRKLQQDEDFGDLVNNASGVVLVDFYADWCGPCKQQAKILQEVDTLASNLDAQIIKVNVDEHPELAEKYAARSLPTLLVMHNGEVRDRVTGLTDRKGIEALLQASPEKGRGSTARISDSLSHQRGF